MAITPHKIPDEHYQHNFRDIHPPFETPDAALVEANRCLYCYDLSVYATDHFSCHHSAYFSLDLFEKSVSRITRCIYDSL